MGGEAREEVGCVAWRNITFRTCNSFATLLARIACWASRTGRARNPIISGRSLGIVIGDSKIGWTHTAREGSARRLLLFNAWAGGLTNRNTSRPVFLASHMPGHQTNRGTEFSNPAGLGSKTTHRWSSGALGPDGRAPVEDKPAQLEPDLIADQPACVWRRGCDGVLVRLHAWCVKNTWPARR
jgi:hypothetical protein